MMIALEVGKAKAWAYVALVDTNWSNNAVNTASEPINNRPIETETLRNLMEETTKLFKIMCTANARMFANQQWPEFQSQRRLAQLPR